MSVEKLLEKVTADPAFADRLKPTRKVRGGRCRTDLGAVAAVNETGDGEQLAVNISKLYKSGR